jgi:DNA polymerase III subunit chi
VAEVLFYHLQHKPLAAVLPNLVAKSIDCGWRAVVQAVTEERLAALDDLLWTYSEESFLPHGTDREPQPESQPVLLTISTTNPNAAEVRFLVEGADLPEQIAGYERVVVLFDGDDAEAVTRAREQWREAMKRGASVTYWQQDERGRWQKKG